MKYLKPYPVFESNGLTPEQEKFLNRYTTGTWSLNSEGLVDIEGDFNCSNQRLESLYGVRFGKVSGDFNCSWNQLTSLSGAPQKVGGNFRCYNNQLTSLEGAPLNVGRDFNCYLNQLVSLEGSPQEVGGGFYCRNNQLTTLKGSPQKVGGGFYCRNNQLTTLEGAPREVGGDFNCSNNQLTSLEGAPHKYKKIYWTEGDEHIHYKAPTFKGAIEEGSILVWDLIKGNKSNKLNDIIENDPSKIDQLNVLFDRDWYTPSPYAMAIYKAWKRGL